MLTGVTIVLLVLIALLAVPVTLTFKLSLQKTFQGDVNLVWLFGLVHVRLLPGQPRSPTEEKKEPAPKARRSKRAPRKKKSDKKPNVFAAIRQKGFRRRIFRFIRDFWHAVHKRDLSLHVRIGLGDPADTGQLWAMVGPVAGILSNVKEASIDIVPEFIDATLELDSSGSIRIFPLQLVYLVVGLLLSPPIWRGLRQMRTAV